MSNSTTIGGLPSQQAGGLLGLVVMPLIAIAAFVFAPSIAALVIVVVAVATVLLAEYLARTVDLYRTGTAQRWVMSGLIAMSGAAIAITGIVVLRAGNVPWSLIAVGGVAGGLLGLGIIFIVYVADERPRLARLALGLVAFVGIVAGARAVAHLFAVARGGVQATLAAAGFLGLFLVLVLFNAWDMR